MLLILAPSKTQQRIDCSCKEVSQPLLLHQAEQLNNILREIATDEIARLMKTSEKITSNTVQNINNFSPPFSLENSHPAIFTFQGDAYSALTPSDWNSKQLKHAQNHLITLSGLYGLLRPLDLMQPYRLEMGLKLETEGGNNLYQFWGDLITEGLNTLLKDHEHKTIINLASLEYSKSIVQKKLVGEMVEIVFKQEKEGKLKTIPIYSKRARGAMANFVVTNRLDKPEELKNFNDDGYTFDEDVSTSSKMIFTCKLN